MELAYSTDFTKDAIVLREKRLLEGKKRARFPRDAEWILEGVGRARTEGGMLHVSNHNKKRTKSSHAVLWCLREAPADFLLEFEVSPKDSKNGLAIIFFCARGRDGQGIFALNKAPRQGEFKRYHSGDLNCYHVSYWAVDALSIQYRLRGQDHSHPESSRETIIRRRT